MLSPSRRVRSAAIAANTYLTAAIDLEGEILTAVQIPAAWTAAGLTFQASHDGTTFGDVHDDDGTEVTLTSAAIVISRFVVLKEATKQLFAGVRHIKIRSGPAASPVTQSELRTLQLITRQ